MFLALYLAIPDSIRAGSSISQGKSRGGEGQEFRNEIYGSRYRAINFWLPRDGFCSDASAHLQLLIATKKGSPKAPQV